MAPDGRASRPDRGGDPTRAGDAVQALLGGAMGRGLSRAQQAARAWYAANGDRERAHTTGVWLRESGRAGIDPVLVVAVDSGLLAGELGTNKDIYLSRLAFRGIHVSDVRFTVSRTQGPAKGGRARGAGHPSSGGVAAASGAAEALPALTPAEERRVKRACAGLPDGLRQSVSRAMCASLRRNKTKNT